MSTQYDSIVDAYAEFRKLPGAALERDNMYQAIKPYVKGASLLDLACGSGQYSHQFAEWGASRVVAVDISEGMIAGAKANYPDDQITFHVGDCSQPKRFDGGPFDIVFGAWLLNYASSAQVLKAMFSNICLNLKDGGRFFGITNHPTNDPAAHTEAALKIDKLFYKNVTVEQTVTIDDGISAHLTAKFDAGMIEFDVYHLRKSVYESAARAAGLEDELIWRPPTLPKDANRILAQEADDLEGDWSEYSKAPHFGLLTVRKK
ncbi:MAG: hypothetical protein Q9174_006193 [Haloplaca sp. 1 TL-2023]